MIVGDFDGDSRDDIAGRLNGEWWVARSRGPVLAVFTTGLWGAWGEAAWRAFAADDATGHVPAPSGPGAASSAVSRAESQAAAPVLRVTDDEPLRLFWRRARKTMISPDGCSRPADAAVGAPGGVRRRFFSCGTIPVAGERAEMFDRLGS